jgi:flagellar biosynthesis/type III secretory pathway protein FliH
MTIRPLGGGWQPAVLFELIHIPKRAPELDIGPSGGPSYERRGSTTRSEEDQFNLKEDVSQPMREGRRREGRQAGGRQEGRQAGRQAGRQEGREGICDTLQPFVVTLHGLAVG